MNTWSQPTPCEILVETYTQVIEKGVFLKFQIERDVLAQAVAWTARTLPNKPALPLLAGVLIQAEQDKLIFSSFDYEVSSKIEVKADVTNTGKILVSGRLLAEISRSLPNQTVSAKLEGTRLEIKCGKASFALPTLPEDDFPSLPELPKQAGSIKSSEFIEAVNQTTIAAGRDDSLPMLTGVRMEITDSKITLAATDRYRLAVKEINWQPKNKIEDKALLIPARMLGEAAKGFSGTQEVSVGLADGTEKIIGFSADQKQTTSRLLDAEFPKYRSLLPTEEQTGVDISVSELLEALKRVELVAERNTPIRLEFGKSELTLRAGAGDEATAEELVAIDFTGEPIEIAFNPVYLKDGLNALNKPTVKISFTTAARPAILIGIDKEGIADESYKYLIMPVRLAG
jgi:DNA polymerase-3 subunit beta